MRDQSEKLHENLGAGADSAASFMVALDALVVTTALSTIRLDLGASIEALEWTVNAYNLSFAVLLLTGAALGDRFGRRRMFVAGLALFVAASAACALAQQRRRLIAARAVQGAGAALVMPLAMALLSAAFPREERAKALGHFQRRDRPRADRRPGRRRRDRPGPRLAMDLLDQRADRPRRHPARARAASERASAPAPRSTSPASCW